MQNLSGKSIPLLVSKLKTAIMTSQRTRGGVEMWRRQEEIKDELTIRGIPAIPPLLEVMRLEDVAPHAADIIGRIGSPEAIVPLAKLLAGAEPQYTKRAAAKALRAINTPDAMLAVNIWEQKIQKLRARLTTFIRDQADDPELRERLAALATRHHATVEQIADAYLLLTTTETLSQDAQARLRAVPLAPTETATLEDLVQP
jgi:HEAT repeat protein